MTCVLLGIGSNIEPWKNIRFAIAELKKLGSSCRFSQVYESQPVGFDGANVYNLVAEMYTALSLEQLLLQLKRIELSRGRKPQAKKLTDRTIDIDLLTYGELCQKQNPRLPREDIYKYAFVLLPLAKLCPDRLIPGDFQTYAEAWRVFKEHHSFIPVNVFSLDEGTSQL